MNFLPARVTGEEGSPPCSSTTGADAPHPRRPNATCPARQALLLGIRPEHMTEQTRAGPAGAGAVMIVDVVEPMGMETMVHFRIGGTPTVARIAPETTAEPNVPMLAFADMNKCT